MVDRLRGFVGDSIGKVRRSPTDPIRDILSLLESGDPTTAYRRLGKPMLNVTRTLGKTTEGLRPYVDLMNNFSVKATADPVAGVKTGQMPGDKGQGSRFGFNTAGAEGRMAGSDFLYRWGQNKPQLPEGFEDFGDMEGFDIIGNPQYARGLEGTRQWNALIQKAARESGVPWQVIAAIMGLESGGNARAGSVAGARGLMQIMPNYWQSTANRFGGNLWDPWTNIRTGAEILKQNYDRWGSWDLAARAYLAGNPYSTAQDAYGTGVDAYSKIFNANLAALGWGQQASGHAGQGQTFNASGTSVWNITSGKQYTITQGYGHTAFAKSSGGYANNFHDGIDIGIPSGTRLNAGVSGTVIFVGVDGGYGGTVKIRTASGHVVRLSHLRAFNVRQGQQVSAGTMVGQAGGGRGDPMAGWSTGAHLHLSVYDPSGRAMDPRSYFKF